MEKISLKGFLIKIATTAVSNSCLMYKNTKSQHLTVKMHSFLDYSKTDLKKFDSKDTEG